MTTLSLLTTSVMLGTTSLHNSISDPGNARRCVVPIQCSSTCTIMLVSVTMTCTWEGTMSLMVFTWRVKSSKSLSWLQTSLGVTIICCDMDLIRAMPGMSTGTVSTGSRGEKVGPGADRTGCDVFVSPS